MGIRQRSVRQINFSLHFKGASSIFGLCPFGLHPFGLRPLGKEPERVLKGPDSVG